MLYIYIYNELIGINGVLHCVWFWGPEQQCNERLLTSLHKLPRQDQWGKVRRRAWDENSAITVCFIWQQHQHHSCSLELFRRFPKQACEGSSGLYKLKSLVLDDLDWVISIGTGGVLQDFIILLNWTMLCGYGSPISSIYSISSIFASVSGGWTKSESEYFCWSFRAHRGRTTWDRSQSRREAFWSCTSCWSHCNCIICVFCFQDFMGLVFMGDCILVVEISCTMRQEHPGFYDFIGLSYLSQVS